jgi:hypothetical protein
MHANVVLAIGCLFMIYATIYGKKLFHLGDSGLFLVISRVKDLGFRCRMHCLLVLLYLGIKNANNDMNHLCDLQAVMVDEAHNVVMFSNIVPC